MASRAIQPVPATYAELRREVEAVLFAGRAKIEIAWVETYHETGRLIHEHCLLFETRANYGARTFDRLSADVNVSARTLRECVQFYRCYPIWRLVAKFGWNRCRLLCQVEDIAQRDALAAELRRTDLRTDALKDRVRALNAATYAAAGNNGENGSSATKPARRLAPKRGTIGVHRIVAGDEEELAIDLGFTSFLDLSPEQAGGLKLGNLVRLDGRGHAAKAADATKADLYTYAAKILRVVDGDTVWLAFRLGPRQWLKEKVRLRGLDAPELITPEGKAAKRFVDALLPPGTRVTVCTTKPDKYDRYLSDIFLAGQNGEGDVFLNNRLLEAGHAERKDDFSLQDWDEVETAVPG